MKMTNKNKNIQIFLNMNPIFTLNDLREYFNFPKSGRQVLDIIRSQKQMGRVGVIKSGLYFSVPQGSDPDRIPVDPYLLHSKISNDLVLAFHSALELLGYAHSIFSIYYSLSNQYRPALRFRDQTFQFIVVSNILQHKSATLYGTEKVERLGIKVTITGKERTLVESLERPKYCGGFEEMYRSLEKIPYIDFDILLHYLDLREQKNLYSRVGYFLEQHREDFHVEENILHRLEMNIPNQPLYWDRDRKGGVLKKRWNLIVPEAVDQRKWEEF